MFKKNPELLSLVKSSEENYWQWLPDYFGTIIPSNPTSGITGTTLTWTGSCFEKNSATAAFSSDMSTVTIKIKTSKAASLLCGDYYLLGTVYSPKLKSIHIRGAHTLTYDVKNATSDQLWDVETKGIRVFHFRGNYLETIRDLVSTAFLFTSELTQRNLPWVSARNAEFLNTYSKIEPLVTKRDSGIVDIDESSINSGDFFGVRRLDGLDPMLAWAMGSTTGHTTVALRINGTLYVCESTATDSYWDVNGIQKTEYKEWLKKAHKAGFAVVHAPLSPENVALFDVEKAVAFFESVEGYDYGYQAMLWGWIDTKNQNFPCLPTNWTTCLMWEMLEIVIPWFENIDLQTANLIFLDAWNMHMNTTDLLAPQLLRLAADRGMESFEILTIVEKDSYMYDVTRNGKPDKGPAMVCDVFVCRIWKAAGLFNSSLHPINNEVNCAELTNYDVYALDMFDKNRTGNNRPQNCIDADPNNPLCQLMGDYTLVLNDYNTRDVFPYFGQTCPSQNPNYTRPDNC